MLFSQDLTSQLSSPNLPSLHRWCYESLSQDFVLLFLSYRKLWNSCSHLCYWAVQLSVSLRRIPIRLCPKDHILFIMPTPNFCLKGKHCWTLWQDFSPLLTECVSIWDASKCPSPKIVSPFLCFVLKFSSPCWSNFLLWVQRIWGWGSHLLCLMSCLWWPFDSVPFFFSKTTEIAVDYIELFRQDLDTEQLSSKLGSPEI